jgi:hypothetical protein
MRSKRLIHLAALGGIVGPLIFTSALMILTLLEHDFMRSLGWDPLHAATFDWPSGLSLGRYGLLMTLTFILGGALTSLFAFGLRGQLPIDRASRIGTGLLSLAGLAICGLAFTTDPTLRETPATWHGRLHDLSFVLLGLTLLPGMLALGSAFRRDQGGRDLAVYTFVTVALVLPAFWLKGAAFYVFLAGVLSWTEVVAIRLFRLTCSIEARL